jgi:hypothetical protein
MNWIRRAVERVRKWLGEWPFPLYKTRFVEGELPTKLAQKTLYLVHEDNYLWHASMLCPCGCGEVLHMNLLRDERPCWQVINHKDGTVSLYPSIWRKKGCCAHFWFKKGKIKWA